MMTGRQKTLIALLHMVRLDLVHALNPVLHSALRQLRVLFLERGANDSVGP